MAGARKSLCPDLSPCAIRTAASSSSSPTARQRSLASSPPTSHRQVREREAGLELLGLVEGGVSQTLGLILRPRLREEVGGGGGGGGGGGDIEHNEGSREKESSTWMDVVREGGRGEAAMGSR
eukprot:758699-Hanusia_phi.AAC.7